ncbi:hypothetical protein AK812_SmicGene29331 [Symbiodinium microadriaticum]|uniref:Uncharacterized protein n=1 Tax=Symbiodinium microadriaticum TaxID=2951 RepID=A0A1Q9D236_SYMMI|nr:hypothetical protein AK812_SmicGene29331 [Symbiodinium microadriaticum]
MSLVPLARFVRRARSLAQAETDMLTATLEAMPRSELRRLYAVAKEILKEDAHSDESSDPTVLSDWNAPDQGDLPSAVDTDLLGLGTEGGSVEPASSADAGPAVPVDEGRADTSVPADLDDHESDDDDDIVPLPPWEWDRGEPSSSAEPAVPVTTSDPAVAGASPIPLAGAPPPWLQELDLNAMDDDPVPPGRPPARAPTVSAPPDFAEAQAAADAAPGTGSDTAAPLAAGSTADASLPTASSTQASPAGAGGQDGGTGGAVTSASDGPADVQPVLPVAQAVVAPPPVCRLELSGSAELPYLHAVDVLQGLEIPSHVLPLRFPLQRLPRVLRDHGHSLSGAHTEATTVVSADVTDL